MAGYTLHVIKGGKGNEDEMDKEILALVEKWHISHLEYISEKQ